MGGGGEEEKGREGEEPLNVPRVDVRALATRRRVETGLVSSWF